MLVRRIAVCYQDEQLSQQVVAAAHRTRIELEQETMIVKADQLGLVALNRNPRDSSNDSHLTIIYLRASGAGARIVRSSA